MWALEAPDRSAAGRWHTGTPVALVLTLTAGLAVCAGLNAGHWLPAGVLRVAAVTAGHGVLLGTALGWAAADSRQPWRPAPAMLSVVALLALAATTTAFAPCGALAYLAIPAWLAVLARRGWLDPLGIVRPLSIAAMPVGLALGAALGGHLVLSAVLTLGEAVRGDGPARYLVAVAYDIGANIPSGEGFFRGALFNRLQRQWSFAVGVTLSTGAYLARYLVDPLLPKTVEAIVGAVVYLALLSVANAWLLWWSGSLLPALASSLMFFAAYRLLILG